MTKQETTKFQEFNLSMRKQSSEPKPLQVQPDANQAVFKALPLPKSTYHMNHGLERWSAPPKMITKPKAFNLNTDRRGTIDRSKLPIEMPPKKSFKSRPMPVFPDPPSPQRSSRSYEFKGKTDLTNIVINPFACVL